jgi:hypothetical protein
MAVTALGVFAVFATVWLVLPLLRRRHESPARADETQRVGATRGSAGSLAGRPRRMSGKGAKDYERDYTDPELRERLKEELKAGTRGGRAGQWSARKSQLLVAEYEKAGGGYRHPGEQTESQKHLSEWTDEDWRHDDGGERYLPDKAWNDLSPEEKRETERRKREATARGEQHARNPGSAKAARKAAALDGLTVAEAGDRVAKMSPAEAAVALGHERAEKARKTLIKRLESAARG